MHTALFLLALVASSYADGHGRRSCLVGDATFNNDEIYFDGLREKECGMGETACFSTTLEIVATGLNKTFEGTVVQAGCMNPEFAYLYDAGLQAVQNFNNGTGIVVNAYQFASCNDSDFCNNVRPQGSVETIQCYVGVSVYDNDVEVFSHFGVETCRNFYTCQSVTVKQIEGMSTKTYNYASCGDPFKTIYEDLNVLPVTPSSRNPQERAQDCLNKGCVETVMGLCICPASVNVADYATFISITDVACDGELCNNRTSKVPSACDSNPCNWMGSCVDEMDGGYMCHCYDGTHGPSCDGGMNMAGTWCMTGERVSMKIPFEGNDQWVNIVNNAAFTRCPEEWGMQCVHYSVNGTTPSGEAAQLDFGECLSAYETSSCSPYTDSEGTTNFITVENCETKVCNSSKCNDFGNFIGGQYVMLPECRNIPTDGELGMFDFRVLPNCSVSEIMHGVEKCVNNFASRFPFYEQPDMCQAEVDGMVKCMADLVNTCLSTNCPTLLDSIPGLRSEYHVVRFFASQLNSVDSIIDTIFMLIPFSSFEEKEQIRAMIPDIRQFLCLDPNNLGGDIGAIVTQLITEQLMPLIGGSLNLRDIMGEELAAAFFCEDTLIESTLGQVVNLLPNIMSMQSEMDACNAFVGFANNMISNVGTQCNFGKVGQFITYLVGPLPGFPMEVFDVLGLVGPLITQFRIPECYTSMNPCDSSPCGYQGTCYQVGDYDYYCSCPDGNNGYSCGGQSYNPCDSNPCGYQGSCVSHADGDYICHCMDGNHGHSCGGGDGPHDNEFNCEQYYGGESQCQMRKAWLCDYAQWRWTTLTVWLGEFHSFAQNNGYDVGMMEMPTCNPINAEFQCRHSEMRRCRYNMQMACNECFCADHEYTNLQGLMDHWRRDYRAWSTFFHKYREMMNHNNGGGHHGNNDTC